MGIQDILMKNTNVAVLFQGVFKSSNINSDEYLKHLSVYINLNDRVHKLSGETTKYSSWEEYVEGNGFCKKYNLGAV